MKKKPIHKFNGGMGATLCHNCRVIINTGMTDDIYCKDCADNKVTYHNRYRDKIIFEHNIDELLGKGELIGRLSKFVKVKRKQVKLTQVQFAEKAGVALTVIRKIEQQKTNYNINSLIPVLKMFGCTINICKE